jgi:K+-sensing histidine kinase KdpD
VTHDVRNGLNSIDLQAAYLAELISDAESKEELTRLRSLVQNTARQLQALSSNFWTSGPNFVTYSAKILVEDLQDRLKKNFPEKAGHIDWTVDLAEEVVSVDIEMLFGALHRIFDNAFLFTKPDERIAAHARIEDDRFVLEILEPKEAVASEPSTWGEEPFVSTRRGGYGLGLFRARGFLAVQDGELHIVHDSGRALLSTRVSLPLARPNE